MKAFLTSIILSLTLVGSAKSTLPATQHDSLWNVWQNQNLHDTLRLKAIYEFGKNGYLHSRPDSAFYFAQLQYDYAKARGLKYFMAKAENTQGISLVFTGNYPEAMRLLNNAIAVFNAISKSQEAASSIMNLANVYLQLGDFPTALETYNRALKIAEDAKDKELMSKVLSNMAVVYVNQGKLKKSLELFNRCLSLKKELNDQPGIAQVLSSIGSIYNGEGNYPMAIKTYFEALSIVENVGDKKEIARMQVFLAVIFEIQGNYNEALKHFKHSLAINKELGDQNAIAKSLSNIGGIYQAKGDFTSALKNEDKAMQIHKNIGSKSGEANSLSTLAKIYESQQNHGEARKYFEASIALKEEIGAKSPIAQTLSEYGDYYFRQADFSESQKYYQGSLSLFEEIGAGTKISETRIKIGNANNKLNQHRLAVTNCEIGLSISQQTGVLVSQRDACLCLTEAYKKLNNLGQALVYYEQMVALNDSLFNEENTKKLTRLEMQYAFDKKEATAQAEQEKKDVLAAQELRQQKLVRNGFMGGFAVVLLFAGVFFTQRNRIGREKKRSEELLLNILPEEVAEELKAKGKSDAQLIEHVTVLFTDFKGFTAMSEVLSPKELVTDLHECFSAFDHICEKFGIEKIKTIGDAYMAAGGIPIPNNSHAKDVVKAALEMAEVVKLGKQKKIEQNLPFFEMRVGIHTGPVVAGIVGVKKFQYDIWGDTVNTASRIESNGKAGKVNISHATYELLKNDQDFEFENRGKIEAKGKGEMEMYFVSFKK